MPLSLPYHASSLLAARTVFNVTIDDKYGDQNTGIVPLYYPPAMWAQGPDCTTCALNSTYVEPGQVMNSSWHDSTYHRGQEVRVITIDFVGTAVYVYNIIVNHPPLPEVTVFTNLTFLIDGITVGNYTHSPQPNASPVQYDVLVYSNPTLENKKHTLQIQSGGGSHDALVLFDYIQYTSDSLVSINHSTGGSFSLSSTSTPSTASTPFAPSLSSPAPTQSMSSSASRMASGTIAAIACSVGFMAIVVVLGLVLRFRARARSRKTAEDERRLIAIGPQDRLDLIASTSTPLERSQASLSVAAGWPHSPLPQIPALPPPLPPPPPIPFHIPHRPPPRHRADVPAPALSVTGTERSLRYEELLQELATLEDMMRGIQEAARSNASETELTASDGQTGAAPPSWLTATQKVRLTSIRSQMKRVRRMIEDERRLMEEALPRSQR